MVTAKAAERWRLLIYTVPSEPSRKRAFVWRELKRAGAVYIRDGVCALPERAQTVPLVDGIAAKIEEFGGDPLVIPAVALETKRAQSIVEASLNDRRQEYAELLSEGESLVRHVQRETQHRDFSFAELEELEADLHKLRAWFGQIQSRDYFDCPLADDAGAMLQQCDRVLSSFLESAAREAGA